ncbi:unnamed protein product [Adineta steineri]|uniref:rhomboid protease n=1 Tax=Adineta steineri TaxID=433720 RepID=A0A815TDY7_9BILA|nr:unnamed protein product [Adineta steineri]CAF4113757.1 unnamed protein product [Adineta steineri]
MSWLKKLFVDETHRESRIHIPVFVVLISIVQISVLIYTIIDNKGLSSLSENPMAGPSSATLIRNGAKYVPCMKPTQENYLNETVHCIYINETSTTYEQCLRYLCNAQNLKGFPYQIYRFVIPIFLHAGIIHLAINLIGQLVTGIPLERKFGFIRIGIIYILSGIGGLLLSVIGLPKYLSTGASGALYGIFAVYLMDMIRNWKNLSKPWIRLIIDGGCSIAWLIVGIFVPMIDYMAHIGGFITGILCGLFICPNLYWNICKFNNQTKSKLIIMITSLILLLSVFLGGFIEFYRTTATPTYSNN